MFGKTLKKGKKQCRKISRACLPNTLLAKSYRLKNCFKVAFDKHVLKKKTAFFLLKIFDMPNMLLKNCQAQPNRVSLGFLTQKQDLNLQMKKKKKQRSNGIFTWISLRTQKTHRRTQKLKLNSKPDHAKQKV